MLAHVVVDDEHVEGQVSDRVLDELETEFREMADELEEREFDGFEGLGFGEDDDLQECVLETIDVERVAPLDLGRDHL